MCQQPATRTTTIRPRITSNESQRLVGEFLWVSPPPLALSAFHHHQRVVVTRWWVSPAPTSSHTTTKAHKSPQQPATANKGQRRSTAAHGRPTQAHEGPQHPTTANAGPRRPTAPNDGTRRPTKATKANTGLAASAQANVHRFFFSFTHCTIVFVY